MNINQDPLNKLTSDDFGAEDRDKLATLLQPYVVFDKNFEKLQFREPFYLLDVNVDKLEVIFLAEKARAIRLKDENNEGLAQRDLIILNVMPKGSIKSSLKKLADKKQVTKNTKGKYTIPNYRLSQLFDKYLKDNDR